MLKEILSISGKPGLQRLVSNGQNAIIVESLIDGKRFQAFSNAKIIALQDISVYTEDDDMPLEEVFKHMYDYTEGKEAINHKASEKEVVDFIMGALPSYDKDRVYVSDMRKMIQWYNLLFKNNLLNFDSQEAEGETEA